MKGRGKREGARGLLPSPLWGRGAGGEGSGTHIGLGSLGKVLRLLLLAFSLFPLPSFPQSALILIPHEAASTRFAAENSIHPAWVRWPADGPGLYGRILALACGADLRAEPADGDLPGRGGERRAANARRLRARGFFDARAALLRGTEVVALLNPRGGVSPSVLLLALSDPDRPVPVLPYGAPLPKRGLVVTEAANWDEVAALRKRIDGRALVVEYPPDADDRWSRFWTQGRGWPPGVPVERGLDVPGLVDARAALALLLRPDGFAWRAIDAGRWGGPNRWLEHGDRTTPGVLLAWFLFGTFVIAWGLAQVMNEDRGPFVSELLVLVALSPAAILLAGSCARLGGLDSWPIVLPLAALALYALSSAANVAVRRWAPEAHPLWAPSAVGLACAVLFDPLWSDFSGRFGAMDLDVPGLALGAFLAYTTGTAAFARGRWLGRALALALVLWGVAARPWWVDGRSALLLVPALALVAAEGLFRLGLLLVLAFLPTGLLRAAREGVAWSPNGLMLFADQARALNLWQTFVLVLSPAWLGTLAVVLLGLLIGNRFLAYRLRKLLRGDPRLRALPWAAAGVLALGVTEPLALPAVPVVALGALVALAYDGLRANA